MFRLLRLVLWCLATWTPWRLEKHELFVARAANMVRRRQGYYKRHPGRARYVRFALQLSRMNRDVRKFIRRLFFLR